MTGHTNKVRQDLSPMATQTARTRYLLGTPDLWVVPYLCCVHCVHWDVAGKNPNNHHTPCSHVDIVYGRKDCIAGQIPAGE